MGIMHRDTSYRNILLGDIQYDFDFPEGIITASRLTVSSTIFVFEQR